MGIMKTPFFIESPPPGVKRLPILVSVPHSGTEVPANVAATMRPEVARGTPDTDWFVHELYSFAPELGITLIHARYSRLVIDLNRDPAGHKLYADGRSETQLVPLKTFAGERVYAAQDPDAAEVGQRLDAIYRPYHQQVEALLRGLRGAHRHVLFWDAHSIKRRVPSIRPEPFADMILGDQKGRTAAPELTRTALDSLGKGSGYDLAHNTPFMGGYLTRSMGRPSEGLHALQLEMAQDVYMNEPEARRDPASVARIQPLLRQTLLALAARLAGLA